MVDLGSAECRILNRSGDAALVQSLLDSDPSYTRRVRGDSPAPGDGHEILVGKPAGLAAEDKVVLGLVQGDVLLALADVLRGWPKPDNAHVGLMFVSGGHRGQGLAHRLHDAVVRRAASWPGVVSLRLSIVDTNRQTAEPLWKHLGYRPTWESVPFHDGIVRSTARIWVRPIDRKSASAPL